MTIPMIVLAAGSAFLGLIIGPTGLFTSWLEPVTGAEPEGAHPVIPVPVLMALTLVLVAGGAALAWLRYWRDEVPATAPGRLAAHAGRPQGPLPGPGQRGRPHATRHPPHPLARLRRQQGRRRRGRRPGRPGRRRRRARLRKLQNGFVRSYALTMLAGVVAILGALVGDVLMTAMSTVPWLTILGLIPLVGALVVGLRCRGAPSAPSGWRSASRWSTLVVGIIAATQFDPASSTQFQLGEQHSWIPQFGVSYALGVDGIALVLILMALVLTPICLLAAWHDVPEEAGPRGGQRVKTYFALILVLETFMVGVFAATDVFLFYVFFEAMLIPVYFLIGRFGGPRRQYAAMKFLLFSLAGGLVMLVAVIAPLPAGPRRHRRLPHRAPDRPADRTRRTERLLFVGFFFAFAVKAPMVPFHTWLPDAATESSPATATLLVGVLDKVGTFGMIRFCLQLFPEASQWATPGRRGPRGASRSSTARCSPSARPT